jgi:hypothetical protein
MPPKEPPPPPPRGGTGGAPPPPPIEGGILGALIMEGCPTYAPVLIRIDPLVPPIGGNNGGLRRDADGNNGVVERETFPFLSKSLATDLKYSRMAPARILFSSRTLAADALPGRKPATELPCSRPCRDGGFPMSVMVTALIFCLMESRKAFAAPLKTSFSSSPKRGGKIFLSSKCSTGQTQDATLQAARPCP